MLLFYLNAALLICSSMLLISVFTYASLLLISYFLAIVSFIMFTCCCELFAVIIFFCEIHVIFMLTCLSLSWTKFDSVLSNSMYSEQRYTLSVAIMLPMLLLSVCFLGDVTARNAASYVVPVFESVSYYAITHLVSTSSTLTQVLAASLFVVSSFEFLLLNVFMTLAVFMYVSIQKYIIRSRFSKSVKNTCLSLKKNILGGYILRSQKQLYQYTKLPIACIFVNGNQLTRWWRDDKIFKKIKTK